MVNIPKTAPPNTVDPKLLMVKHEEPMQVDTPPTKEFSIQTKARGEDDDYDF
jgi:hypothetical protein